MSFPDRRDQHLDLLTDLMARAKRAGADAADAIMVQGASLNISFRLGKLEDVERSEGQDLGLRVLVGKRQAFVSTTDLSSKALDETVARTVATLARLVLTMRTDSRSSSIAPFQW
jgi:PmbA protein